MRAGGVMFGSGAWLNALAAGWTVDLGWLMWMRRLTPETDLVGAELQPMTS
jgi:hypothetical protein